MGAWSRTGLEATTTVSLPRAKHSALNWSTTLQSVGTVAHLRFAGLATLDTCGAPPQVVPSNLRDLSVQANVYFLVLIRVS